MPQSTVRWDRARYAAVDEAMLLVHVGMVLESRNRIWGKISYRALGLRLRSRCALFARGSVVCLPMP